MTEEKTLLNEPEVPKLIKKPTAAANRATGLVDQANSIDAASIGGIAFRSASSYLAASLAGKGHRK